MRIERDSRNCQPCYFLSELGNHEPACMRTASLIKDVASCHSGRLVPFPSSKELVDLFDQVTVTGEEFMQINKKVEKNWREGK